MTIEDVAAQAGCSVRTVTRYFPTKDALLLAQRRRMNQVVLDAFETVEPGEAATLESAHGALIDFWVRRGGIDDLQALYRTAAEFLGMELQAPFSQRRP